MNTKKYKLEDFKGRRFGRLVVIGPEESYYDDRGKLWRGFWCQCDCGNTKLINIYSLIGDKGARSCGCLGEENRQHLGELHRTGQLAIPKHTTHNLSHTREYSIWSNMRSRCKYESCDNYKYYGGQGIKVCEEWDNPGTGFLNFYNWAHNNGYADNLEIDRINSTGDYTPENCRWRSRVEQNNNKSNNIHLNYYGFDLNINQWSEITGLDAKTIRRRKEQGWSDYDALSVPKLVGGNDTLENYKLKHKDDPIKPILEIDRKYLE